MPSDPGQTPTVRRARRFALRYQIALILKGNRRHTGARRVSDA